MKKTAFGALIALAGVGVIAGLMMMSKPKEEHDDNMHSGGTTFTKQQDTSEADLTGETKVNMDIADFAFSRPNIKIKKGTTVTWTNQDTIKHNAFGENPDGPKGQLLAKGESYSFTFSKTGTFPYICEPHPYMKGTVNVVD